MIKLISKVVLWLVLFPISMIVNILAFPLSPIISLISLYTEVPKIFSWWMTHDNSIDGDKGHINRWNNSFITKYLSRNDKLFIYIRRVAWLWRNKGYTFDYKYSGCMIGNTLITYGDPLVSDNSGISGTLFQYNENGNWEFYFIHQYSFNSRKCLRIRLGWKLDDTKLGTDTKMMLATSIGIYKSFNI